MDRKKTIRQKHGIQIPRWLPWVCSILIMAALYVGLWYFVPNPLPRYLMLAGVLILWLIGVLWSRYLEYLTIRFSDSVCDTIDQLSANKAAPHLDGKDNAAETRVKESLYRYYEVMTDRQADTLKAKQEIQEIVSDISHQVKTPISNVKIYASILRNHELEPDKKEEFLDRLDGQIDKLDFLMQSMIKMSRLETGIVTLSVKSAPLYDTIIRAMNVVLIKAEEKQIELSADCNNDIAALHDSKWTAEALGNILDNAVKYTPKGGSVSVTVRPWQYYVRIDISDTGIGIPEEHYHDIFKRFYRTEEVAAQEGVGIGLYLAREIITYEKGYISVKSKVGMGTTFSVYLPNPSEI